jgi:hypothetical protein
MRSLALTLVLPCCGMALAGSEKTREFRFTRDDVGKVPAGWKAEQTGKGDGSVWKVIADRTAPSKTGFVLAQTASSPKAMFNLCIAQDTSYRHVEISVAFKAHQGEEDQGGGIVWRFQDADNYYIARMNALADNYRFYKVVAGKRIQLATRENIKVPSGEWHTLRIRNIGDKIECDLDGKNLIEAIDDTFKRAGKVGLWTKADARTYFDQFRVRDLAK